MTTEKLEETQLEPAVNPKSTYEATKLDMNESAARSNACESTKEKIIGEITVTEPDSDSKGNLTLDDMPHGVSSMHAIETSSVISEPEEQSVLESTTTTSTNSNNKSKHNIMLLNSNAKKAKLKSCIIN